ncbi:hypothetical protein DFJ74DRAFT_697720 [Hyaloraphidium curvatum]|nr:hypothetical protein DFJ74DRAFT_697720 [Hyaloraphidium curvatum]
MEALLEAPSDADAGMPAAGKWIWAVDADAVVTNHSLRIADLLRAHGVDPLTGSLARGGRVDLVMTADCNGPNSGSVLWRASPAALLVLRAAWGAYGAGVPGLVVREGRKQGAEDGVGMDVYAGSSALAGYLHLLDEGCRPTAPEGGGIQRLLANLTLPCLRSFHSLLSSTEAPDAPRDPSVPPLPPLAAAGPQYHEQASLRHALATLLPSAYLDRALFLPQHAVNAYPAGLHAACPPFSRHPLPGLPAEGREWRRGDLLAHYPSCKHRHLGGDGWAPGEGDHVQKVLAEGHEVPRDVCGEWVEKWAAWYGKDGLEGAVGAGGRVVS